MNIALSIAVTEHRDQEELLLLLTVLCNRWLSKAVLQELMQDWNLEAAADVEAMEGCCLVVCSVQADMVLDR